MPLTQPVAEYEDSSHGDTGGRSRLGEILLGGGVITQSQLDHALAQQKTVKLPLGEVLVKLNYLSDESMRQALSLQLNVPYLDLDKVKLDRELAKTINRNYARRHSVLPVALIGRTLTVAMDDPTSQSVVEELRRLTTYNVTVVTSSNKAIQRAFKRIYEEASEPAETGVSAEAIVPVDADNDFASQPVDLDQDDIAQPEPPREAQGEVFVLEHLLGTIAITHRLQQDEREDGGDRRRTGALGSVPGSTLSQR